MVSLNKNHSQKLPLIVSSTIDSVTHLVFKNGSPATLKKAMSKNIFIINLLWISNCKREGKKVAEHEYMIDKPQGLLVTSGKKRRKSMEPGKVRALVMEELLQPCK